MKGQMLPRQIMGMVLVLLLLVGCAGSPEGTLEPALHATPTTRPVPQPTHTAASTTATPDPCTGWRCTLGGVVYVDAAASGSELAGTLVELSHMSYCSPTRGQHKTLTGPDGGFEFEVFLHDTDTFWIEIERDGYEPVRQTVVGFDCLYCVCPLIEIVLEPQGTSTPAP